MRPVEERYEGIPGVIFATSDIQGRRHFLCHLPI